MATRLLTPLASFILLAAVFDERAAGAGLAAAPKDLTVLSVGVPRTHVLAELGAPVWTEEGDRGTTDVFAFKQSRRRGVKALRTLSQAAINILSFGLAKAPPTRLNAGDDGTDVKVEVSYDEKHNVQSVHFIEGVQALNYPAWLVEARRRKRAARDQLPSR
jgi:hypothetical protein